MMVMVMVILSFNYDIHDCDKEMTGMIKILLIQPRQCSILIERASPQNTKSISLPKLNIPGDCESDHIFQNDINLKNSPFKVTKLYVHLYLHVHLYLSLYLYFGTLQGPAESVTSSHS